MSADFVAIIFVIVGSVVCYAVGYFRERMVPGIPAAPELPQNAEGSLRALLVAYSEEVKAKYLRNHSRRRAEKFFKEFALVSLHLVMFMIVAVVCVKIDDFNFLSKAARLLVALAFLTMALKSGQFTASKETVEQKEKILHQATDAVNQARVNMMDHNPPESWLPAMQARDEKTPLHY